MKKSLIVLFVIVITAQYNLPGQDIQVPLRFDHYYSYDQVVEALQQIP